MQSDALHGYCIAMNKRKGTAFVGIGDVDKTIIFILLLRFSVDKTKRETAIAASITRADISQFRIITMINQWKHCGINDVASFNSLF